MCEPEAIGKTGNSLRILDKVWGVNWKRQKAVHHFRGESEKFGKRRTISAILQLFKQRISFLDTGRLMLRHHFFNFRNKVVVTFPHLISLLDIEQISAQSVHVLACGRWGKFEKLFFGEQTKRSFSNFNLSNQKSEAPLRMSIIAENSPENLCTQIFPHVERMLSASLASSGDLEITENAIDIALKAVRSLIVESALKASGQSAPTIWGCPNCKKQLCAWNILEKYVVTSFGAGTLPVKRFRCRQCRRDYYPFYDLNDLNNTQFTIGARNLIANEAADAAFNTASSRLNRMGVSVSPSEVERISDEIGEIRKQEEELVRVHLNVRNRDLNLPLYEWKDWTTEVKAAKNAILSVDGAKIRSDQVGPKGLEWFEVRSGVLTLPGKEMPKAQIAGDISPEALFENMQSIWRQSPVTKLPLVFVADGAEWIWDRVEVFFPNAIQVLDIYHAGEHVASAARATWGDKDARTQRWVSDAINMLKEEGPRSIIRQLLIALRHEDVADREELIRNIRYLWRHRHRMNYPLWKEMDITIGSGTMESRIKQVSTMRLRKPGMMWTKTGADLMLRLRAAVLSQALPLTIQHHRTICSNRLEKYKLAA
jgi:hypothetical protein